MKTSTASFTFFILAGMVFSTSNASFGSQMPSTGTQNVIESIRHDIDTLSIGAFFDNDITQAEESRILINFISEIVNNTKPMPAEFAQLVNDNFWDLVD